jgi:hypothetical protein
LGSAGGSGVADATEGGAVLRKLAFVAICLASLAGNAVAQDASTVIANQPYGDQKTPENRACPVD